MIHGKSDYRRLTIIGPGGWKCGCCAPQTSKALYLFTKAIQKRYCQKLKKLVQDELFEHGDKR